MEGAFALMPIGYCIALRKDEEIPDGFVELNSQVLSRKEYPVLYEALYGIEGLILDENAVKLVPDKFIEAYGTLGRDISRVKFVIKVLDVRKN